MLTQLLKISRCATKTPLFLSFLILFSITSIAQDLRVTGQVLDRQKAPLPGVSVLIKGTNRGTSTTADGRFVLENVPSNATLVVSSTGFGIQEIRVDGQSNLNITMDEEITNLNEVVVIGYGTQQKKDVTGSVASIKATKLENENPANVQDLLRANIAGLTVGTGTDARGGGSLLVRGRSSLTAGTSPLIVLDGVIYPGSLSDINPNDISTIDVLKDASSAAVFGAKSASGVILITTKRGTKAKATITLNTNIGIGKLGMNEPLYDGPGFVRWRTDVLKSINAQNASKIHMYNDPRTLPPGITIDQWKAYDNKQGDPIDIWLDRLKLLPIEVQNFKAGKTVDWYDMMFQTGFRQDHTVSVSGRKEDFSYYMSLGYMKNEGIVVGDDYSIFRTRVNLETRIASFISVGMNMQFADRNESAVPVAWNQMINASPYGELYKSDGETLRDSPNDDIGNNINPLLSNAYTTRLERTNSLFGSIYAKGNLPFGFSYQVNFTPNFNFYRFFNAVSAKHFQMIARGGVAERTQSTSYNWQIDNLLKWNKTFGDHQIDVTLLANAEKFQSWRSQMNNEGFSPNDNLSWHSIGLGIKPTMSSDDQYSTGDAYMARANYSYDGRYMLTASFRRDGYSAFGLKNPRADFPAIALGWVFTEEKFMGGTDWMNYGKLRASWGVNGNRDIGRYAALALLQSGKYQFIRPDGTIVLVSQLYGDRLQNPNLKWEETTSYNLGLDFAFLRNRISGSVDLYKKETHDLLVQRTISDVSGYFDVIDNLGQVDNKGIEVMLNTSNITKPNFSWSSTFTFSLNRNEIVHLYGEVDVIDPLTGKVIGREERDDIVNRWFIGHDINEIWDLKVLGVWQEKEAAEAAKYGVRPGDFKVQDVNGDGKFSDDDRQFVGFTTPRFQWSLRNDFSFMKNFDFSFMLYSIWGQKRSFNQAKNNSGFIDRQNSYRFEYWTPENPTNEYGRLYSSNGSAGFSVYRESSFIRLSTVSLGYTFPKTILSKAKMESIKIYANVTNAGLYAPDWNFWDPEYGNAPTTDNPGNAPAPRYYSLGLNVTF